MRKVLIIAGIITVIALIITIALQLAAHPHTERVIPYTFNVSTSPGVNVDDDALHFGSVEPGQTSLKGISVETQGPARMRILVKGEGSSWIEPSWDNALLGAGENQSVEFLLRVPVGAEIGRYEGSVIVQLWQQ